MKYSFTLAALATVVSADFTSIFNITATPDQVVTSTGAPAPGQPGAIGQFNYAIDSNTDTICYDITLTGVTGDYQSAALTATHIHQGLKGASGPPRIVFPNPGPITDGVRRSVGCLTGPFVTGIKGADNVTDTGAGFKLSQIEANPAGFFTDSHTALFVPGAVRGQLDQSFKLIDSPSIPPSGNGSVITTATLTKTVDVTITQCPAAKTDCPANEKYPAVVKTAVVYTVSFSSTPLIRTIELTPSRPSAQYLSCHTTPRLTHQLQLPQVSCLPVLHLQTRWVVPLWPLDSWLLSCKQWTGCLIQRKFGNGVLYVNGLTCQ